MPACIYIPDHKSSTMKETGDKELDSLLLEANKLDDDRWRIGKVVITRSRLIFRKPPPLTLYTLYWFVTGIEYQIVNLATPRGGSIFYHSNQSKEDILNYLMGYLQGRSWSGNQSISNPP